MDLIIKDQELKETAEKIDNNIELYKRYIMFFSNIINGLTYQAVPDGELHKVYENLFNKVTFLKNKIDSMPSFYSLICEYIDSIETADLYFYDGTKDGDNLIRNFTDAEKENVNSLVSSFECNSLKIMITNLCSSIPTLMILTKVGAIEYLSRKNELAMLAYHGTTKKAIESLFLSVNSVDEEYRKRISSYLELYTEISNYIADLINIMDIKKGDITIARLDDELDTQNLEKAYGKAINFGLTSEDISNYITYGKNAFDPLSQFHEASLVFLNGFSDLDAFVVALLNHTSINIDSFIYGEDGYRKKLIKSSLLDLLKKYSEDGSEDFKLDEAYDAYEDATKYTKKIAKEVYDELDDYIDENGHKIFDKREKWAKELNKYTDELDVTSKILKYGDETIDLVYDYLHDYTDSLDYLESLKKNTVDTETLEIINQIEDYLKKDIDKYIRNLGEFLVTDLSNEAIAELWKVTPIGEALNLAQKTIDIAASLSGLDDITKAQLDAATYNDIMSSAKLAYTNAVTKVRSIVDTNSEEFESAMKDAERCFKVLQDATIKTMENMADGSSGTQKAYYEYCSSQARIAKFGEDPVKILTYEEFMAL